MQVHTEQRQVMRGNVQNEHAFTIKASAKAFNILSSNLYSDKPLAIVRELCCNAYDSHVAAGCADRPIEVILPTRINPQLVIKDFGTGLNHEQMIAIYTKFFESTKTESNDFVGQLGLGSKSPFSMFKTFSIEARKDGWKRVYTAYLNEEGIPTIAQMSEVEEDCENGVTVTMHVKPDDMDKFHNAAKRALMYFDPKPIVSGSTSFATFTVKHGIGGSNWKVRESDYWARMSGPYVVQGFVVYPIDAALIKESGNLSAAARVVCDLNIDFWMPIGSVDVAPSREALSYDKRTVANLAAAFEKVADEMRTVLQADFDTAKTMYEAGCKLYKYENTGDYGMRRLFDSMHDHQAFTWNGKEITYKHELDVLQIKSTVIMRAQSSGRKLQYSSKYEPTTIDTKRQVPLHSNTAVLIDDVVKGSSDLLKQFLDDGTPPDTAIVLRATKKAEYDEAEIKRIIKMMGDVPVKKVSELPYKRSPTQKTTGRGKEQRLRFTSFPKEKGRYSYRDDVRRTFSRLTWKAVDVDLDEGGFYMPIERFSVIHNGKVVDHIDVILDAAVELGLLSEDEKERTYGFNEKEIAQVANDPDWVNLFDHLAEEFVNMNIIDKVAQANAVSELNSAMSDFNRHIGAYWDKYESMFIDGAFKAIVNKSKRLNAAHQVANIQTVNRFTNVFHIPGADVNAASNKAKAALIKEWDDVIKAHGLLRFVNWYHINDLAGAKDVIDYINALAIE